MRILIAESEGFSRVALDGLRALGDVTSADLHPTEIAEAVGPAEVLFVRLRNRIGGEVLDGAPRLRVVVSPTTGVDHLDLEDMEGRGIAALTLRGETDFLRTVTATAEHTWALLLALLRRLPAAAAAGARGDWDRDRFRGRELSGKTLGIVGLGRLGSRVATYGTAFGMRVLAFDPYLDPWPEGTERAPTLRALLERSDVVTLHVPLDPSTRDLLGAEALAWVKPGAVLLNTSRGGIVDEDALVESLRSGRLAGAALDVLAGEPDRDQVSRSSAVAYAATHDELLVTPHVGGATLESMENTEIFMVRKLTAWLRGETVRVDAGPASGPGPPPLVPPAP